MTICRGIVGKVGGMLLVAIIAAVVTAGLQPWRAKAAQDNSPPQLTAFSMSPTSFSTESADQTLTLSVTLTDDQAGVCTASDCGSFAGSETQVRFLPSSGSQTVTFTNFTRTSGDDKNGTYTATAIWPKGIKKGDWTVSLFTLVDKLGNATSLTASQIAAAVPGATGTTVTNTAADDDTAGPTITAFSVSPTSFSTESSGQTLTATVTIADDQAGVCSNTDCGSYYRSSATQMSYRPQPDFPQQVNFTNFTRVSGTDKNGVYTATGTWKTGSKKGTWGDSLFLLVDKLGNTRTMSSADISSVVPGSTGATVTNTATHDDTSAPKLTAFSITPTEINTENGDQTLYLTATITDDQAGVCTYADDGGNCATAPSVRLAPLIGTQTRDLAHFTRISGDDKNGVYTDSVVIPAHSKEGIWQVQLMTLQDRLGNAPSGSDTLTADTISAIAGASGTTIVNTASASSVTVERDWTISSADGSVTFPAGTVVTKKDGGSFAFYKMLAQPYDVT